MSDLPADVKAAFLSSFNKDTRIADRDEYWDAGDVIYRESAPRSRFISAARLGNLWLIYYEHGGRGKDEPLIVLSAGSTGAIHYLKSINSPNSKHIMSAQELKDYVLAEPSNLGRQ